MEELTFSADISKMNGEVVSFTINEQEVDYILQQIKFNLPFVIVVDDSFFCFSPNQCVSIEINPIK